MKHWIAIGAAALQLLVLAYMAGERELILLTGRTIYLRTAPIDPQDAFRGDYVRLDYEISHAASNQVRGGWQAPPAETAPVKERRIYAALKMQGDLAELTYVSDRKPAAADVTLRGKVSGQRGPGRLDIQYGLEAYFLEQGKGLDLERGRREGDIQIPLEMAVAVAGSGKGVLKGHRWSPLGIGLDLLNENQSTTDMLFNRIVTNRVVVAATVILLNASSNDLAVVDLPQGQSLALEPDTLRGWVNNYWQWVGAGQARPVPTDADVHVLKPREKYSIRIELRDPAWFVRQGQDPARAIGGLSEQFRLYYRPPDEAACRQLKQAALIWHGNLPSRAFNGGGRVD
jgi:uncharacterized membrane-anchored protein